MPGVTFKAVAKRAFAEAAEAVRWNKPVPVIAALIISASSVGLTYSATGSPSYGGLAGVAVPAAILAAIFLWKLITVPLAMAREAVAAQETAEAELEQARQQNRDPDGIYQHGQLVGRVILAEVSPGTSFARFQRIEGAVNFDESKPFDYRNWVLLLTAMNVDGLVYISGVPQRTLHGVSASIVGAR